MFSIVYRIKSPSEFSSMVYQVNTSNKMKLIIFLTSLLILIFIFAVSLILTNSFRYLSHKIFSTSDSTWHFELIFIYFLFISSIQVIVSAVGVKYLSYPLPIMYMIALIYLAWKVWNKSKNVIGTAGIIMFGVLIQFLLEVLS